MILKHLGVRGYKSLKNVTVDFTPITVVVGDSDCGKTNLFSVFTLLQAESYRQVPKSARLTFDTSLFYGDEKETPALSVKASGDSGQSGLVASLEANRRYLLSARAARLAGVPLYRSKPHAYLNR